MGFDEEYEIDEQVVVNEESLLRMFRSKGCVVREADDNVSWEISKDGNTAFFPRAFGLGGYAQPDLDMIERILSDHAIEIFPLHILH